MILKACALIRSWGVSFILIHCSLYNVIAANEIQYPVSAINDSVKNRTDIICRIYETELTILSKATFRYRQKVAYTFFNDKYQDYKEIVVFFDKQTKINFIKGSVYDSSGAELKRIKKTDIYEQSAVTSGTLMQDDRVKFAKLSCNTYPHTIEFEYELESDKTIGYPQWQPQDIPDLAVEKASYKVTFPDGLTFRYKESGMDSIKKGKNEIFVISKSGTQTVYKWNINNLQPAKFEEFNKGWDALTPTVWLAPNKFEYCGFEGNMETWKGFGEWQNKLNADRNDLPETTRETIKKLTHNAANDIEKTRKIYEYLQNKTRYVSIQLGIGGLQPFKASLVDSKSYGDCKALSFYTKCLLESVGIKSYYTIIYGGHNSPKITPDFPINRFNHIILCVPLKDDTIWLECTSQTESFGYLSSFTSNRYAMVVTEEGGKLIKTPRYSNEYNTLSRTVAGIILPTGDARISVSAVHKALQSDEIANVVTAKPEQQKEWLNNQVPYPDFSIDKFIFDIKKERIPIATQQYDLTVRKFASKVGKRIFVTPLAFDKWDRILDEKIQRTSDIYIPESLDFTDDQTIEITIPPGYKVEAQPAGFSTENEFGKYSITYSYLNDKILCIRKLQMVSGLFSKEKYGQLAAFYRNIKKNDNQRFVFVSLQ